MVVELYSKTQQAQAPMDVDDNENELLGSYDDGLAIIKPPKQDPAIGILTQMNKMFRDRRMKLEEKFNSWVDANENDDSIRHIQGGRMELFLQANGKSSTAFDKLLGEKLPPRSKELILDYAKRQAKSDPRVKNDYKFGNFSLIVSFGMVEAQAPHIDLTKPNRQFGLMVSDEMASTMIFESPNHLHSVDALVDQWQKMSTAMNNNNNNNDNKMTPALIHALKQEPVIQMLLESFGDVLFPARYMLYNMKKKANLPTGTLLSLPGTVVHAAPAAVSLRAVIFFSGVPTSDQAQVAEYNPDIQYTGVMLAGHITSLMWNQPRVGYPERLYLLQRLAQYVEGSTVPRSFGHFGPGNLCDFVGNMERMTNPNNKEKYIAKMAHMSQMGSPRDPFSEDDDAPDLKYYHLVSVKDLSTLWKGEWFDVEIHRHNETGKIIMRYPATHEDADDEFEGGSPKENFRLTMKKGCEHDPFDGKNGHLLDTEGEVIVFQRSS